MLTRHLSLDTFEPPGRVLPNVGANEVEDGWLA